MVMSPPEAPTANIFDTGSLDRLRHGLKSPEAGDLRQVAEEFESVFVGMMLKNMRAATPGDSLFGGPAMDRYQQLHDQQLARGIGSRAGFGIADMVERQLREQAGLEPVGASAEGRALGDYARTQAPLRVRTTDDTAPAAGEAPEAQSARAPGQRGAAWSDPEAFVRDVWPAARAAGERLGVDPRALVAQSALETGWGQHVIRDGAGNSSHNLFGIKAGPGWQGPTVEVPTLEFREGIPQREMASFRAYDSVEASFRDYADFLESNPRYRDVLAGDRDAGAWADGLQRAGYATDPAYAEKIRGILRGSPMDTALQPLKPEPQQPINRT